jgi:RNA polymerase sigma-70 factor (ECF subfamily)
MHGGFGQAATARNRQTGEARVALSRADFVDLIHQHAPALYRIAYRMVGDCHDAEDIVQETLRSAWKSRGHFQCGRGRRAWLAAILRRRVIDRWRRHGRQMYLVGDGPLEVPVAAADPAAELLGVPLGTVLSRVNRARLRLRKTLLAISHR